MWTTPGSRTVQPLVVPFAVVLLAHLLMHAVPVAATPSSASVSNPAAMPQTETPKELCSSGHQLTCGATQSSPAPAPALTPPLAGPPAPAPAPSPESEPASEGTSRASRLEEEGISFQGGNQGPQPLPAGDEAGNVARAQALLAQGAAEATQGDGVGPAPDAFIPETRPPRNLGPVVQPRGL